MGQSKKSATQKQNPQLMERKMKGGRIALYLEYYIGRESTPKVDAEGNPLFYTEGKMAGKPMYQIVHHRRKESLNLYLIDNPRTPEERQRNNETRLIASKMRYAKEQEFLKDRKGYSATIKSSSSILDWFDAYLADDRKSDERNVGACKVRFQAFLAEVYPSFVDYLPSDMCNTMMAQRFWNYLYANSKNSGAATSFARFKKVCKYAYEKGLSVVNICDKVEISDKEKKTLKDGVKEILEKEEILRLMNTRYNGQSEEIRRAVIFTLYTGMRWCDIKHICYSNVDRANMQLSFIQAKTQKRVVQPMRADLLELVGIPEERGKKPTDLIFDLPSHTMCNKALDRWVRRAGIKNREGEFKHITWHSLRHSLGTYLLTEGANVRVVADTLGHSNLNMVFRYTRAIEEEKVKAMNTLPSIKM